MDTLAGRLRRAIQIRPSQGRRRGVRLFQTEMEERSRAREAADGPPIPGVTLPSIQSYVRTEDPVEPSLDFLRAAADLLGVRFAWLVAGEGEMTTAEERVSELEAQPRMIDEAAEAHGLDPATRALFFAAWRRLVAGLAEKDVPEFYLMSLAADLLGLLELPRRLWGYAHELDERTFNDFAAALLHALMLAMPEPGAGDTIEERGILYAQGIEYRFQPDAAERVQELFQRRIAEHKDEARRLRREFGLPDES